MPWDLAFITTPAKTVPELLEALGKKGVKGAVIITSGFSETDEAGKRLEKEIVRAARKNSTWIIGPNTMGIICPHDGLFATGSHPRPTKRGVGGLYLTIGEPGKPTGPLGGTAGRGNLPVCGIR